METPPVSYHEFLELILGGILLKLQTRGVFQDKPIETIEELRAFFYGEYDRYLFDPEYTFGI